MRGIILLVVLSILGAPASALAETARDASPFAESEPRAVEAQRWSVSMSLDSATLEVVDATDYLLASVDAEWEPSAVIEYNTPPRPLFPSLPPAITLPTVAGRPAVVLPMPRLGYRIRLSLDVMELQRQTHPLEAGLPEPIRGLLFAATPVLEVRWPKGSRLEVGAGLGYGKVKGRAALYDRSYVPGEGRPFYTVEGVDTQGLSVPWYLYWGAEFKSGLLLGMHVSGLSLTGEGNSYRLSRYGLRAGWRF